MSTVSGGAADKPIIGKVERRPQKIKLVVMTQITRFLYGGGKSCDPTHGSHDVSPDSRTAWFRAFVRIGAGTCGCAILGGAISAIVGLGANNISFILGGLVGFLATVIDTVTTKPAK